MSKKGTSGAPDDTIDIEDYFNSYIAKTYYKTASMISLGCRYKFLSNNNYRGLGVIYGLDIDA